MSAQSANERLTGTQPGEEVRDHAYELLVNSVKDHAIFMLDPTGRILTWNPGAQRLKQYAPSEIIGKHLSIFYPPEEVAAGTPQRLLACAEREGRVETEGWRVRKDGSRFWANVVLSAARDADGRLAGFAKVTRDLTERRAAEEKLRRSEEQFRLIVDTVGDYAIFMLDPQGRVETWNSGAQRIKQYEAREIIGQSLARFYTPEDLEADKPARLLAQAARDGSVEDEGWRVRKDGSRFWADVLITAVHDASGELRGYSKVTRDLTSRREAEEERLRLAQAREALGLRDEFLSIASHELRTPLTALQLQLEGALHRAEPEVAGRIERALRSASRLTELIDTLLDVSRIATGRIALKRERADLRDLAQEIVDRMQPTAAKAGTTVTLHAPAPVPGSADTLRLGQVLSNLIANSIKYGEQSPIELSVRSEGGQAVLEVADRGPGLPQADLERIFGRFERAASMRNFGGLGLGLYVARQIVEAHGGQITAHNRDGGGARFIVRVPLEVEPRYAELESRPEAKQERP